MTTLTNDALVPVFATRVRGHARQLDLPDASVEIAFDEGMIEAGGRQEALSEIELELKSGNAGILFDLGAQLLDAAPLQVGTRSKAERGYALAFDVVQPAAKAEPLQHYCRACGRRRHRTPVGGLLASSSEKSSGGGGRIGP